MIDFIIIWVVLPLAMFTVVYIPVKMMRDQRKEMREFENRSKILK